MNSLFKTYYLLILNSGFFRVWTHFLLGFGQLLLLNTFQDRACVEEFRKDLFNVYITIHGYDSMSL